MKQYKIRQLFIIDKYSSLLGIEKEIFFSELKIASNEKKTFALPINQIVIKEKYFHVYK